MHLFLVSSVFLLAAQQWIQKLVRLGGGALETWNLHGCCGGHFYRPQRSYGKVMFSQASVILFTGGGLCQGDPPDRDPPDRDLQTETPRQIFFVRARISEEAFCDEQMKLMFPNASETTRELFTFWYLYISIQKISEVDFNKRTLNSVFILTCKVRPRSLHLHQDSF